MLGQGATLLDQIPGGTQAVRALLGQVAQFQRVPSRLTAAITQAVATKRAAEARNDLGTATNLALVIQSVMSLQDQYPRTSAKVADVLEGLRQLGFASATLDLAVSAAQVAGEVAAILQGTSAAEAAVGQAAGRVLTPEEIAALKSGGAPTTLATVGGYAKLAGLAVLGYLGLLALRRRGRSY